jgi:beta-fructofuranosidase
MMMSFFAKDAVAEAVDLNAFIPPPKYIFSDTLAEQRNELADNPLVAHYKACREEHKKDPYYPTYHFLSPQGRIGDPNGLCFWKGHWHLFYQFHLEQPVKHVWWGHAVSDDLVHWKDLPPALYPRFDNACFSGNTFVEKDRVVGMYHSTGKGNQIVVSDDPLLLNWQHIGNDPEDATIPACKEKDAAGYPYRVWDPFVFGLNDGNYYSISGIFFGKQGQENEPLREPVWHIFKSGNLKDWEYKGQMLFNDRFTEAGDDGSCTYFWPLGKDKWLLTFFSHRIGSQHMLGTFDEETLKFEPESHAYHNIGPSSVSPDPDKKGEQVIISNLARNKGASVGTWGAVFSVPRQVSLGEKEIVYTEPVESLKSLRGEPVTVSDIQLDSKEQVLPAFSGKAMELELEIDPGHANYIDINVLRSPDGEEYTTVRLFRGGEPYGRKGGERWTLTYDMTHSADAPGRDIKRPRYSEFLRFDGETLKLRIFVDVSFVEGFANRQAYIPLRVYPKREDSLGVSVRAQKGGAKIIKATAWPLNSVW